MNETLDDTKILLTTPYDLNVPGGVNTQLWGLYSYLKYATGAEIRIVGPASRPEEINRPDVTCLGRIFRLPMNGAMSNLTFDRSIKPRVQALIQSYAPDIVHFQELFAPVLNNYVLKYSRAYHVATFHTYKERMSFGYLAAWPYLRYMLGRMHVKIAVSKAAARFVGQLFPDAYQIIPNAIDPSIYSLDQEMAPRAADKKNLLFVGRAEEPRKGFSYLLKAYRQLETAHPGQYRLIVAGSDGQSLSPIPSFGDIQWMGRISDSRLQVLYAQCDLVCAPSIRGESFGVVLLEAFAHAKPVVGFRNTGYDEFLGDHPAARLTPLYDDQALAEAIHRICSDVVIQLDMSQKAAALATQYTWEVIGPRLVDIYRKGLKHTTPHDTRQLSPRLA